MSEHTFARKKTTAANFSQPSLVSPTTPTLANPVRGFGLPTNNELSTQQQELQSVDALTSEQLIQEKPRGHDISRISFRRPQTKLTVGEPGDKYEQEADTMAHRVMAMTEPTVQRQIAPALIVQRAAIPTASHSSLEGGGSIESRLNSTKGGGSPLTDQVRSFMEPRFGVDFSQVRVHTDSTAVQMSRELGAQAFTHGSDVYFGEGKSPGNNELTAHELTHVVQQLTHVVQQKDIQEKPIQKVENQLIQRIPHPIDAHTFRAGLSPVGAIYKNTYDGSASTTIKSGWEAWSFERRWQLYDANDNLLDESYYTIPQPTYKIDKKFVLIGTPGGYEKPWSIWLKVTKTLVPFGGNDKKNFPHSYITFPVFNTPLDDTKAHESKAAEQEDGLGIAIPKGKSPTSPANTKVTPNVALEILENVARGEPPFKPELGKAGCSWFVTEGNPYTGIDANKSINIPVEIVKNVEKVVIDPAKLNELFAEMLTKTDVEAETTWRIRNNKVGKTLTPAQERQLVKFKERFAESRMWDRVGEIIRSSKDKVGEVIVEKGRFSETGSGKFAVVADAKMIQVKGGIPGLLKTLQDAGISAEPVVVEAAEALAKKQRYAGQVRGVFRIGGKILFVVAVAADLYKIYYAENKLKATITSVGGWAGATAAGAAFAALFTPADTAGPLAWAAHGVGTLVAGGVGYWIGSETTRYIYELVPANER